MWTPLIFSKSNHLPDDLSAVSSTERLPFLSFFLKNILANMRRAEKIVHDPTCKNVFWEKSKSPPGLSHIFIYVISVSFSDDAPLDLTTMRWFFIMSPSIRGPENEDQLAFLDDNEKLRKKVSLLKEWRRRKKQDLNFRVMELWTKKPKHILLLLVVMEKNDSFWMIIFEGIIISMT